MENIPNPNLQVNAQAERKSHLDKLAEVFLPSDLDRMGESIMNEVIVPTIIKSAHDILINCIDTVFGIKAGQTTSTQTQQIPYSSISTQQTKQQNTGTTQIIPVRQGVYDYMKLKYKTRDEAISVVNNMRATIANNGHVTVAQYYQWSGQRTLPEDSNYGWISLNKVLLQNSGDPNYPYRLELPPVIALSSQYDSILI